jgi:hypothetical protein
MFLTNWSFSSISERLSILYNLLLIYSILKRKPVILKILFTQSEYTVVAFKTAMLAMFSFAPICCFYKVFYS